LVSTSMYHKILFCNYMNLVPKIQGLPFGHLLLGALQVPVIVTVVKS
jgi:hypothetical protein